MISQFRTLNPFNILLLVLTAFLLRAGFLLQLPARLPLNIFGPFQKLMIHFPATFTLSPAANVIYATLICILQALLLNKVVNTFSLNGKPSFLPALMYVTTSSLIPPFLTLTLPLLANFFMIWIISKFLSIYRRDEARSVMYDLGMITGAGTLFYFPVIAMIPLLWISLSVFRPFNWREWLSLLMGFATVYFFLGFLYYWNDALPLFYKIWIPLTNRFVIDLKLNLYDYVVFIPMTLILVLSFFSIQQNVFRGYVQVGKSFRILFAMLVLSILSFYLEPEAGLNHFVIAAVPAAVFMAYYFVNARTRWFYESLYFIVAACVIYFQWA